MSEHFTNLNDFPNHKTIKEMRKYAQANKIPVLNDDGLALMLQLVDLVKPKHFLEIGTAIGFCAINVAAVCDGVIIDTIEKNREMYQEAVKNVEEAKMTGRIRISLGDALEFDTSKIDYRFDIIFIDAAKAQYARFFEKFSPFLADDGIIVSDNLLFHGLVEKDARIENRNLRSLVDKIRDYNVWLSKQKNFKTLFLAIGDGMAVTRRNR